MSAKKERPAYTFSAGLTRPPLAAVPPAAAPAPEPAAVAAPPAARASARAPSREGRRAVTFYLPVDAWQQLKMLTIREDDASVQSLMEEATNDLFSKRGANRFD